MKIPTFAGVLLVCAGPHHTTPHHRTWPTILSSFPANLGVLVNTAIPSTFISILLWKTVILYTTAEFHNRQFYAVYFRHSLRVSFLTDHDWSKYQLMISHDVSPLIWELENISHFQLGFPTLTGECILLYKFVLRMSNIEQVYQLLNLRGSVFHPAILNTLWVESNFQPWGASYWIFKDRIERKNWGTKNLR